MRKIVLASTALLALSGCASFTKIEGLNSREMARVIDPNANADDEFRTLVNYVGADAKTLHGRSIVWNKAELGFGLAVLAAAAYGGFNSVYDGSNLKDAAFAAASIGALRSFVTPGDRRDAYLAASASMTCLYEKASVFTGKSPGMMIGVVAPAQMSSSQFKNALQGNVSPAASLLAQYFPSGVPPVSPQFRDTTRYSGAKAKEMIAQSQQIAAFQGLFAGVLSEQEIYDERFILVSSVYLKIIGKLLNSTKFSAPDYDASLERFKKAAGDAAAAEQNTNDVMANMMAQNPAIMTAGSMAVIKELLEKYAQAKVDLLACAPAN